ncbi:unnamed protein product [Spirodela intermedia]|uniref:Fe2OG dioxygenase domain-containing protein n=1 Tax=Spirodela intermedia TaxID=51605 RepID=A0A7I8LKI4_SPIIN|nr:unnamed protein product [Spirodela intermedia]
MELEESAEADYMKGVKHLCECEVKRVPTKYILPVPDRTQAEPDLLELPIVDISDLHPGSAGRERALSSLADACRKYGLFQVVNHGLPGEVLRSMIEVSRSFFKLPLKERERFMSSEVLSPVRYGTSFNQTMDGVFCWRDFLKLTSHPLPEVLSLWPASPPDLREVAVSYARETRNLFLDLMAAIMETLGVEDAKMMEKFREGSQLMVLNFFPPCPQPELTLGMPPHSDYGFLTVLLQDGVNGLQMQHQGRWATVNAAAGSLLVNVGDHLEIFSNGKYKSVLHRVFVNATSPRVSVASLHSLSPAAVVSPSPQLVTASEPRRYMDTGFAAFLHHLSSRGTTAKSFLESRKLAH